MPVFYPNQKLPVTEIESPEEITADSPDGIYIQEGGSSTPSGGTTIHYYDNLEQVPADLPEGSFVAVPSITILDTVISGEETILSAEDSAKLSALNGMPTILNLKILSDGENAQQITVTPVVISFQGTVAYVVSAGASNITFQYSGGNWIANIEVA